MGANTPGALARVGFGYSMVPPPGLGVLQYLPSRDHAIVTSYEARLYADGTSTPVVDTLNLGKPYVDIGTHVRVDISAWLGGQATGDYQVKVAAIAPGGTSESAASTHFSVPLVPESS